MAANQRARRLSVLEAAIGTLLPRNDQITLGEWRRWHGTGQQPQRWLGNAVIQQKVQQMLERQRRVDETIAAFDGVEHETEDETEG